MLALSLIEGCRDHHSDKCLAAPAQREVPTVCLEEPSLLALLLAVVADRLGNTCNHVFARHRLLWRALEIGSLSSMGGFGLKWIRDNVDPAESNLHILEDSGRVGAVALGLGSLFTFLPCSLSVSMCAVGMPIENCPWPNAVRVMMPYWPLVGQDALDQTLAAQYFSL